MDFYTVDPKNEPTDVQVFAVTKKAFDKLVEQWPNLFGDWPEADKEEWIEQHLDQYRGYMRAARGIPLDTVPYDTVFPDYGDVMTVKDFIANCEGGGFIDYDGFGTPANGDKMNGDFCISPSTRHLIPKDATHIIWYNR